MNRTLLYVIALAGLVQSTACSKNGGSGTGPAATFKKPNSILYNWEYNGTTWVLKGFMLLDLDHADNKDKSYLVVEPEITGTNSFRLNLKKGPLPIDSLATNWPAAVRQVSFGYSNDMTVNAFMRMQNQVIGPRLTYRYDSIQKFSTGIYMYNYLQNPLYAGSMAGKTPQGREAGWGSDGGNNAIPRDIIYYFKEGAYSSVVSPGNGGLLLKEYANGVGVSSEMWKKIDATLTIEGYYYTHLYFDFDEWQFFTIRDWCPSVYGSPCQLGGVQVINFQSMNNLMTWPAGWGKQ